MATGMLLAALGAILVVAFLAAAVFRRTHVPDILWLLLLGAILGPVTGIMDVAAVAATLPLVAALAVIIILFDGALEVTPNRMRSVGGRSLILAIAIFATTTFACGAVAWYMLDLVWAHALLLGMAFGGAGIAIIVPLARRMGVSGDGMTVIVVEAVTSDILVILGVFMGATLVVSDATPLGLAKPVLLALGVGLLFGAGVGWIWTRFLRVARENAYLMTLAALVLLYAATEAVGGSGPLAVLLFGLVVGNAKHPAVKRRSAQPVLDTQLIAFHHEVAFFIRAFFFVSVGVVTDWTLLADPGFLLTGVALTLVIAVVRGGLVALVMRGSTLSPWDRIATGLMFPMGLVTAAVSVVPFREFAIVGTEHFADVAAVVILLTNVLATIAVFGVSWVHAARAKASSS